MASPLKMVLRFFLFILLIGGMNNNVVAQPFIRLSTPTTIAAANVCASATNVDIYAFTLAGLGGGGTTTVTGVTFSQSGTGAIPGDIVQYKLWKNSGGGAGVLLSTTTTGSFTGFTESFTNTTTTNYWITADIAASPTSGRTIIVDAFTNASITASNTVFNFGGTIAAGGTQTIGIPPTAITGNAPVCVTATVTLGDGVGGGTWASNATGIATINTNTGLMRGVAQGNATITYANACGSVTTTATVNATPGTITGTTTICTTGSTTLSDAATGGTWSSSNTLVASISGSGVVNPSGQGTTTITYANGCGAPQNTTVTVNGVPGAISGSPTTLCMGGSTTQLSDAATGGTWSSNNGAVAGVGLTTGLVTSGGTQGLATVTYDNGCGSAQTVGITVNGTPSVIAGSPTVCSGSTTQLSDAATGGTWSSDNTSVAAVDGTGLVTGGTSGNATITYGNGCGSAQSATVTVNAVVTGITGTTSLCTGGGTTQLSDAAAGGTWSSDNTTVATVDGTGLVTGGIPGNANITYSNGCGSSTVGVTVNAVSAGSISGATAVCVGSSISLTDNSSGGAWSSSNTAAATVSGTGVVFGAAPGTTVISYTVSNICGTSAATYTVTAANAANAGTIVGPSVMCAGTFTVLTDAAAGGVWSAQNADATVTGTGLLTAVTPGVDIISYTVTNVCGPTSATLSVTIDPVLNAGTISGAAHSICAGNNMQLSDNISGGAWSSTNTSVATISGVGLVHGVSAGTTTISYLVTSGCGSIAAVYTFTVNDVVNPGTINGPSAICSGTFALLTDAVAGGAWSSTNTSVATIDGTGLVYGNTVGSTTISYSFTNGCGTSAATLPLAVSLPPDAGTITGSSVVCTGSTISLTDAATGGVWSSSNTNASVSGTGTVTGLTAGTTTISYTSTTACGSVSTTAAITVLNTATAGTISGPSSVCVGSFIALTDATAGGVWTSNNTAVATVDASGNVTGVGAGSASINYVVTNACSSAITSQAVVVNALPVISSISGASDMCVGSTVTLSDATAGGIWTSSNTNVSVFISASGLQVTGVTAGVAIISYTVTNGFGCSTMAVLAENVDPLPVVSPISGPTYGCVGATALLSDATAGGAWSSDNTSLATIDPATGQLSGIATGTFNVGYTVTSGAGCTTTVSFADTIRTVPDITATTGSPAVCEGAIVTLSNPASGGVWSTSNGNATVSPAGDVTGITAGTDYIIYAVTNVCGTTLDSAFMTVNPAPAVASISAANSTICAGVTDVLNDATAGGVWSSANTAIATVDASGLVTGVSFGTGVIMYTFTNTYGCSSTASIALNIGNAMVGLTLAPDTAATLCHGNPVTLQVTSSSSGLSYQWSTGSTPIPGATNDTYTANIAGTYSVLVNNGTCTEVAGSTVISVAPNPIVLFTVPDVLYTGSFTSYQWLWNGNIIPGETSSVYHETGAGAYQVVVTDANGCSDTSAVYTILATGVNNVSPIGQDIKIYPNPASNVLHIDAPVNVNISILSLDGKLLITQKNNTDINVGSLASGMYIIMISDENNVMLKTARFTKE